MDALLELRNATKQYPGVVALRDCSFDLRPGEVHALVGENGAGKSTLIKIATGAIQPTAGRIVYRGEPVVWAGPRDAMRKGIAAGIAYLPEDRDEEGVILDMDVTQNITLPILPSCTRLLGRLDGGEERRIAAEFADALAVKSSGLEQKVGGLSGGNKQKVSLAKWLASHCRVLILDEPTKGIDVASKAAVHEGVSTLAAKGQAIIMISSDLPEIMGMADRVLVLHEGIVKGEFARRDGLSEERIMAEALRE